MNTRLRKVATIILAFTCSTVAFSQTYVPGNTYYDATGYIEYRAGNLPIVLSAPHGGSLEPSSIPNRDCTGCVYVKDSWTQTIAEGMYDQFVSESGLYPHVIINLLHRKKLDANRDIGDAADGNATIEQAWQGYHSFIDAAKAQIVTDHGKGIFLDIHGHAHSIQRIEVGYLLSASELRRTDAELNTNTYIDDSSIKNLVRNNIQGHSHSDLLRGVESFGSLMNNKGFPSVPSLTDPFPNTGESYFSGGYNTQRHGSQANDGAIDGIQLELNSDARFDQRSLLIKALTTAANEYVNFHYNDEYFTNFYSLILSLPDVEGAKQEFKIYPNPATNYFELDSDLENVEITIYNNLGEIVHSEIWSEKAIKIDFLPTGYYFIQLSKDNNILDNIKLIKY